ncbi:hypothetical protein IDH44_18905 [Paenibacillus sp. IB182496]|uniref:Uncharacterized protein n=1 Tax=Paenibacillus sabuli TaxID=2772509 RepID=A0A927GSZ2_9BACL|nr:hypothetical protein [Paenibacillus sabuli]MBD2847274.1 hypothetical protein [Paenibacillus sabuli]
MRKLHPAVLVVVALVIIGIADMLFKSPGRLLLPVAVLGIIFLLYKFGPGRLLGGGSRQRDKPGAKRSYQSAQTQQAARQRNTRSKPDRKRLPFRVIEGGKDNDDLPKYH